MPLYEQRSRNRSTFPSRRLGMLIVVVAAVAAITAPVAGADEGGATIAAAPTLTWGAPQDGIGGDYWFDPTGTTSTDDPGSTVWRIPVFAGDEITLVTVFSGDTCPFIGSVTDRVGLLDPSVTDANLLDAQSLNPAEVTGDGCGSEPLHARLVWRLLPFTGLATLQIRLTHATTFSFVATVRHRTLVQLANVPRTLASPAETVLLQARVTSAAGSPSGLCAFDRRTDARGSWLQVERTELTDGTCTARIAAAAKHSASFRVRYLPDPAWLPNQAITQRVLISEAP